MQIINKSIAQEAKFSYVLNEGRYNDKYTLGLGLYDKKKDFGDYMLFSIVIPVYNVEKYLDECMRSILQQADSINDDCEILLIDDGSNDSSGKICDTYVAQYPSIVKAFHKENQGLLATRRYGFKRASGEYIINCDSDDLLEDGALEKLNNIIKKYKYPDVIIYNHNSYDGKNKTTAFKDIFTNKYDCVIEKKVVLEEYLSHHSIVSVCGKMVKRTCIDVSQEYAQFGRISTGEDTLQTIEFFSNAETFVYLNQAIYDYRYGSGMTGKFDKNYYFTFKRIFEEIEKQRENWNLSDFDKLFAVKVLQTAGRAITQSRYNKWSSTKEQIKYLESIRNDPMLKSNYKFISEVRDKLQHDHYLLLLLLKSRLYNLIILLLKIRNVI